MRYYIVLDDIISLQTILYRDIRNFLIQFIQDMPNVPESGTLATTQSLLYYSIIICGVPTSVDNVAATLSFGAYSETDNTGQVVWLLAICCRFHKFITSLKLWTFAAFKRRRKQACIARVAVFSQTMITRMELSLLTIIDNDQSYCPNP